MILSIFTKFLKNLKISMPNFTKNKNFINLNKITLKITKLTP